MASNKNSLELELITPAKVRFSGEVSEFNAPALSGEVNVLPEHTLYMTRLEPGIVSLVASDGSQMEFAVYEGFLEIEEEKAVILVEDAFLPEEIDVGEVAKDLLETQKQLDELLIESEDYRETEVKLKRLAALSLVTGSDT